MASDRRKCRYDQSVFCYICGCNYRLFFVIICVFMKWFEYPFNQLCPNYDWFLNVGYSSEGYSWQQKCDAMIFSPYTISIFRQVSLWPLLKVNSFQLILLGPAASFKVLHLLMNESSSLEDCSNTRSLKLSGQVHPHEMKHLPLEIF